MGCVGGGWGVEIEGGREVEEQFSIREHCESFGVPLSLSLQAGEECDCLSDRIQHHPYP